MREILPAARRIATVVALAYVMLLAGLMALEDRFIFFPRLGGRVQGPGIDLALQAQDGTRLHARYIERPGATYTLLYLHGNAGNLADRSDLLELFAGLGMHVLALEYRGYGQSDGVPSEVGLYVDARAAYDWAVARIPASKLVVWGESLGGGPACELAATRELGGVILQSTFTSIPDMAALSFPFLPVRYLVQTRFDNLAKVPKIRAPLLVIHSRNDELIPFEMGERLYAAAREPKQALWLDRSGHNDTLYTDGPRVAEGVAKFLQRLAAAK